MLQQYASAEINKTQMGIEEALISVWRQSLLEEGREVHLNGQSFPVRTTPRKRLLQVDFDFEGKALRGLEQNPATSSNWARLAREGHKIMQVLSGGHYLANVVDGEVTLYRRAHRR